MTEQLLTAVVQRLRATLPTFSVEPYPDDDSRFQWAGKSQHLLVAPEGSTFAPEPMSLDPLSIDEAVRFSVTVLVRSLRGDVGAVTTLQNIRSALLGWSPVLHIAQPGDEPEVVQPLGFGPVVPERSGFVSEKQGTWRWVIAFRAPTVAVAETEQLSGPPLQSVEIV